MTTPNDPDKRQHHPPDWPVKLLRFFVKKEYVEEIEGDMEEIFQDSLRHRTPAKAKRIYAWEMLQLLRPILLKNIKQTPTLIPVAMLQNYFKIAWRNLIKKTAYSAINILGLALGIACCFLIFIFVQDELSYDNYHANGDRIFRLIHGEKSVDASTGRPYPFWVWGNAPVGERLANEFPEVDKVVQFSGRADILLSIGDKIYQEEGVFFMDSTAFEVFTWALTKGNPKTALAAPYSIVLTETAARKYFGDEDPMGRSLKGSEASGRSAAGDYLVTGVMKDLPSNSHFRFNVLLSMSTFKKSRPEVFDAWGYVDFYTYFMVNEKFDQAAFERKIPDFIARNVERESKYTFAIEPLKDVYLRTDAERQPGETGSLPNIYVFSIIGIFILSIAIINFMNLSTARSMERAKEVGIRKSIGAYRSSLIFQFLGESFIVVLLSLFAGLIFVAIALPSMADFTGKEFALQNVLNWQTTPLILGALIIISIVAGSYPALALSGFGIVNVLKGNSNSNFGGANLRRVLVVFQFSLSIALIAGTIIVYMQINHLLNKDLGFDKDQMLVVDYNYDDAVNVKSEAIKIEMEANPNIVSAAFSRSVPGSYYPHAGTVIEAPDGEMKYMGLPIFQVGMDFITHFGLELVGGRSYSRDFPSDSSKALVLNEAAAKEFGYKNPADIIGKKFSQWGREGEVIGVVKDFNYVSLHGGVAPLTLPLEPFASRYLTLKIKSVDLQSTIREVGMVWKKLAPHRPFIYSFLDEDFNRQYQSDFIFRKLFTTFSCLAIFIACLGLLGLATYTAERRTKEIGIRKVLGADVSNIIALLSKDFITLVIISIFIATPVSWYYMDQWLEGFAYRMEIQPWIFVLAGFAAVIIAVITISYQSVRSARMNPVSSLRSE
jgi:putative ABC transport system permease protein